MKAAFALYDLIILVDNDHTAFPAVVLRVTVGSFFDSAFADNDCRRLVVAVLDTVRLLQKRVKVTHLAKLSEHLKFLQGNLAVISADDIILYDRRREPDFLTVSLIDNSDFLAFRVSITHTCNPLFPCIVSAF